MMNIYTYKEMDKEGKITEKEMIVDESSLIKPADLPKHIGEVLSFHNGKGYVVTGVLSEADMTNLSVYDYGKKYETIEYEDELDMGWYYQPTIEIEKYETLLYAYLIKVQDIHHDEIMHDIKYISVPTKDELDFRNKILGMDNEELTKQYKELEKIYG